MEETQKFSSTLADDCYNHVFNLESVTLPFIFTSSDPALNFNVFKILL